MSVLELLENMADDTETFFKNWPEYEDNLDADMDALIAYVTTLSKIHNARISIFTVPETTERERYTRVDVGFGSNARTRKGWGDDLHGRPDPGS